MRDRCKEGGIVFVFSWKINKLYLIIQTGVTRDHYKICFTFMP